MGSGGSLVEEDSSSKPLYRPSRSQRWLCLALFCLLGASLGVRVFREMSVVAVRRSAVSCEVSGAVSYGRAAPGTVLSDRSGCVNASRLDAGVCVEDTSTLRRAVRCVPSLAVIGAMKSGTTNIMLYLNLHPRLRTSENRFGWPVESRYFSGADDATSAAEDWRSYLALYPAATALGEDDRVLTFDKSPNYLLNTVVPNVLAKFAPALKLVVMLRDPTKRAYSHLQHECRNGRLRKDRKGRVYRSSCVDDCGEKTTRVSYPASPDDFHAMVAADLEAHRPGGGDRSTPPRLSAKQRATAPDKVEDWVCAWSRGKDGRGDSNVLPRGFYDCQLARWLKVYPRHQLKALIFEEFLKSRADTLKAVAQVEDFLGVPNFDYAHSPKVAVVEKLYAAVPSRGAAYSPMRPDTKAALDDLYCDPNRKLATTLGRPLPWPCAQVLGQTPNDVRP